MQSRAITPTIIIADQPSGAELTALKADGYVGVINLRQDGEPEQPIGTAPEGAMVRAEGLDYLHHPVGAAPLTDEGVVAVSEFLDAHGDGKVLVHCRKGGRAAALVLLHFARREGWSADEAFQRGEAIGLKVDGPGLRGLVASYLAEQAGG